MKTKPILEEIWQIKDELAREAGYDLHRLCENIRQWAATHPHAGPRVSNAEELRSILASLEQHPNQKSAMALNEAPPKKH